MAVLPAVLPAVLLAAAAVTALPSAAFHTPIIIPACIACRCPGAASFVAAAVLPLTVSPSSFLLVHRCCCAAVYAHTNNPVEVHREPSTWAATLTDYRQVLYCAAASCPTTLTVRTSMRYIVHPSVFDGVEYVWVTFSWGSAQLDAPDLQGKTKAKRASGWPKVDSEGGCACQCAWQGPVLGVGGFHQRDVSLGQFRTSDKVLLNANNRWALLLLLADACDCATTANCCRLAGVCAGWLAGLLGLAGWPPTAHAVHGHGHGHQHGPMTMSMQLHSSHQSSTGRGAPCM